MKFSSPDKDILIIYKFVYKDFNFMLMKIKLTLHANIYAKQSNKLNPFLEELIVKMCSMCSLEIFVLESDCHLFLVYFILSKYYLAYFMFSVKKR